MGLYHCYRWLTSKDYRIHCWVGQHLGQHRAAWTSMLLAFAISGVIYHAICLLIRDEMNYVEVLKEAHSLVIGGRKGNRMRKTLDTLIELWEAK